jgi:hypothetical protein
MLVGVLLPGDEESTREMAYAFAEEFASLGKSRDEILWLFANPFYAGAHQAYRVLGKAAVAAIVDECVQVWSAVRIVDRGEE